MGKIKGTPGRYLGDATQSDVLGDQYIQVHDARFAEGGCDACPRQNCKCVVHTVGSLTSVSNTESLTWSSWFEGQLASWRHIGGGTCTRVCSARKTICLSRCQSFMHYRSSAMKGRADGTEGTLPDGGRICQSSMHYGRPAMTSRVDGT